ncbi:uncharacterized protein LOC127853892 isoform X3 [Dreissena polymorpha]|uniref:uncharacterized protein LOC127853892 isoform X3 n=1 Tax=Dreissena polymorpha TaxID=45954 RepID=UPI002263C545|nr:uncharacterized protein LOC127853892 isoform X3 [Dreissena polymorpha]
MLAFFLAIYIGVCCSATPNAENEGCPDLNNHTNWETIGPNIQNIKMLQTGRAGVSSVACPDPNNTSNETMWQHTQPFNYTRTTTRYTVQCEPGYNALGFNGYHDSIVALCDNDTWTANAVCREIGLWQDSRGHWFETWSGQCSFPFFNFIIDFLLELLRSNVYIYRYKAFNE